MDFNVIFFQSSGVKKDEEQNDEEVKFADINSQLQKLDQEMKDLMAMIKRSD